MKNIKLEDVKFEERFIQGQYIATMLCTFDKKECIYCERFFKAEDEFKKGNWEKFRKSKIAEEFTNEFKKRAIRN